jgi:hypothetical protein
VIIKWITALHSHYRARPNMENDKKYLTAKELAALSGVSSSSVRRYQKAGKIPYFQPGGKNARVVFPPAAIEQMALLNHQETPVKNPTTLDLPNNLPGPTPGWLSRKRRTN